MNVKCPFCGNCTDTPGENPTQGLMQCPKCGKWFSPAGNTPGEDVDKHIKQ